MRIIYTSIEFLDTSILDFSNSIFTKLHPKVYCDHITLKFYDKNLQYIDQEYNIENLTTFEVIGYASDDKCQVLVCNVKEKCYNLIPHITVATNNIAPKYSNNLLANGFTNINPITFNGIIRNKIF